MMFTSKSTDETLALATQTAAQFKGGEILGLSGELGSGKTTFVKGLAEYFGITDQVSSPTFTLIQEYLIDGHNFPINKLIHIDCYRLDSERELTDIGLSDYLSDSKSVVIIEWAEKINNLLPPATVRINFEHGQEINERIITKS